MPLFCALYGYDDDLSFVDIVFGDRSAPSAKDWIQESQDILKALKDSLQIAQNQQKIYADRNRVERHFEVGDLVFLCLKPYTQSKLKQKGAYKLQLHFYEPYRVIRWIGEVAYELELFPASKAHNVFHVSCLKKVLGQLLTIATELEPEVILETKEKKLGSRAFRDYLV